MADDTKSQDKPSIVRWLGWIAAAIAGGAFFTGNPNGSQNGPTTPPDGETTVESKSSKELAVRLLPWWAPETPANHSDPSNALNEYFKKRPEYSRTSVAFPYLGPLGLPVWFGLPVKCFIATVPDPVKSQFGVDFDSDLCAIQWAFQSQGYELVKPWLPWPIRGSNQANKPLSDEEKARMKHPGILLFSRLNPTPEDWYFDKVNDRTKSKPETDLALVFLVGERPMTGVDRDVLDYAIHFVRNNFGRSNNEPIRILGPHFSGSQDSFASVLKRWKTVIDQDRRHPGKAKEFIDPIFEVVTGSASEMAPDYYFETDGLIRFRSTVIPNRLLRMAVYHFMANGQGDPDFRLENTAIEEQRGFQRLNRNQSRVAILRESDTSFGGASVSGLRGLRHRKGHESDDQPIDLPFPIAIAQLKNQYKKWQQVIDARLKTNTDNPLVPPVPTQQNDSVGHIAARDPDTTATVKAEQLGDILTLIKREKVQYVGIQATDSRDILFLSSLIYEYCPGVRTFTTVTDIMLTVPQENYHMRGMIVATTYPTFLANQEWTRTRGRSKTRLPFASEQSQGYYNAMLALMGGDAKEEMLEYRVPTFDGGTLPGTPPIGHSRPPIWICSISQDGDFIPLRYYANYDTTRPGEIENDYMFPGSKIADGTVKAVHFYKSAPISLLAFVLGCGGIWIGGWAIGGRSGPLRRCGFTGEPRPLLFWKTQVAPDPGIDTGRRLCLFALFATLFPLWFIMLGFFVYGDSCASTNDDQGRALRECCFSALTLVIVSCAIGMLLVAFCKYASRQYRFWVTASFLLLYIIGVVDLCFFQAGRTHVLFIARATSLSTGLSILVPLILLNAALFVTGFFKLRQAHIADRFSVACPFPVPAENPKTKLELLADEGEKLRKLFREPITWIRNNSVLTLIMSFLFVSCLLGLIDSSLPTLEGRLWDYSFVAAFTVVSAGIAFNLMRFLSLWSQLKQYLRHITDLNMGRAFDRLTVSASAVFAGFLMSSKPRLAHLAHPVKSLRRLSSGWESKATPSLDHATAPREICKSFDDAQAEFSGDHEQSSQSLRDSLSKFSANVIVQLEPEWRNAVEVPPPAATGSEDHRTSGPSDAVADELKAAEEVVAFQVASYLNQFFALMRMFAYSMAICSPLLLLAAACYPFVPSRALIYAITALMIGVNAGIVYVLIGINKNDLINRICKTPSGFSISDLSFLSSIFTLVIPVALIAILHFFVGLRTLFEPIMRIVG